MADRGTGDRCPFYNPASTSTSSSEMFERSVKEFTDFQISHLKNEVARLEGQIKDLCNTKQDLIADVLKLTKDLDDQHRENIELITERNGLKTSLETLKRDLVIITEWYTGLTEVLNFIADKYPEARKKIDEIRKIGGIIL